MLEICDTRYDRFRSQKTWTPRYKKWIQEMCLKQNILSKNKDIHLDHPVQSKQIKCILGHIHSKSKEKDLLKLWQLKFRLQVFMVWIFLQLFFTSNSSIQTTAEWFVGRTTSGDSSVHCTELIWSPEWSLFRLRNNARNICDEKNHRRDSQNFFMTSKYAEVFKRRFRTLSNSLCMGGSYEKLT